MDAVVGWVSAERPQKRSATHGRGKTRVRFYGAALIKFPKINRAQAENQLAPLQRTIGSLCRYLIGSSFNWLFVLFFGFKSSCSLAVTEVGKHLLPDPRFKSFKGSVLKQVP